MFKPKIDDIDTIYWQFRKRVKVKAESRVIESSQQDIHQNLNKVLERYSKEIYQRPLAEKSIQTFSKIKGLIQERKGQTVVLDLCCGVGLSCFELSKIHQNSLIIGLDKSESRLNRKNDFKQEHENVFLFRGEILDLSYLIFQSAQKREIRIQKQYLLFPNPYPKSVHLQRRWHANPIFPFLLRSSDEIELRTNWKVYADEFSLACKYYDYNTIQENA